MDGIDQSPPGKSNATSPMSALWKSPEEAGLPADFSRDRGRPQLAPPPSTPFVMTPSQATLAIQANFPPSPRNGPGSSTAPASMAPSRRGSWSAPDDGGMPRPSSSASTHVGGSAPSHLHPSAGLAAKRMQSSPTQPQSSSAMSPTHHGNGIRLPPLSPPNPSVRSPLRVGQPLPPLPSSTVIQPKSTSPKVLRRSPPPNIRPKSPGREQLNSNGASASSTIAGPLSKPRPVSPVPVFAVSPSIPPPPLGAPRMPNVSNGSDSSLPPVPQSVPS